MASRPVVAHGVVHQVAHGLLDERLVSLDHHRPLGDAELDGDAGRPRHRPVALDHALHQRAQVQGVALDERLSRLELGRRAQVVDERREVLRLLDGGEELGLVEGTALGEPLAEAREVPEEDGERDHDVVGGVGQEGAQGAVALVEGGELRAHLVRRLVEGAAEVGDLVVAADGDGRTVVRVRRALDVRGEDADASDHGAGGEEDGAEEDRDQGQRASHDAEGPLRARPDAARQDHRAPSVRPARAHGHLQPIVVAVARDEAPARVFGSGLQGAAQVGRELGRAGVGGVEAGVVDEGARGKAMGAHARGQPAALAGRRSRARGRRQGRAHRARGAGTRRGQEVLRRGLAALAAQRRGAGEREVAQQSRLVALRYRVSRPGHRGHEGDGGEEEREGQTSAQGHEGSRRSSR